MEEVDENDVMMQGDDDNDNNSIPTTMGVRASCMEFSNRNRSASHLRNRIETTYASNDNISVAENIGTFFIPLPIPAPGHHNEQQQQMNLDNNENCDDDDISTLTECSMEENEDDNLSQTTANTTWTCVTEVTASTTAAAPPQQNFGNARKLSRRRIMANKRTRVQQSQEASSNPLLSQDSKSNKGCNDQWKRRRKA